MLTHRGFSACIETNGFPLPEYLVSTDEKKSRVSCWIPGIEGQSFTVHWCDEGSKVSTCSFIILDGVVAPGRFLHGEGAASRGGIRVSKTTERPFVFRKVKHIGSALQEESTEAGLIVLKIKKIKCVAPRAPNPIQAEPSPVALGMRKVGDLCVGFGEEMEVEEQHGATWGVSSFEDNDPNAKPRTFVSFAFRYRSPEFLENQGIAPLEETQPWKAHKRRIARRSSNLPPSLALLPIPETVTPPMPTLPTFLPPPTDIGSLLLGPPLTHILEEDVSSDMGTSSSSGSEPTTSDDSEEQPSTQLAMASGSMPLFSEGSSDLGISTVNPDPEPTPTQAQLDQAFAQLGKGKAPHGWRPWIDPVTRAADPRRVMSWKLPRPSTENGSSIRSIRGVERTTSAASNTISGPSKMFQNSFMVSLPHARQPQPPKDNSS